MIEKTKQRMLGKIYFSGEIVFENGFVSVSSGIGDETTDNAVYQDSKGKVIIPGTSFAGIMRSLAGKISCDDELEQLFGNSSDDKNKQKSSDIVFTDLYSCEEVQPFIQQGVKINPEYLSAENKGKYDRQIAINKKFDFFFYIEKTSQNNKYLEKWKKTFVSILQENSLLFIGGRNSVGNGWGYIQNSYLLDYDFSEPPNLEEFLLRNQTEKEFIRFLMKQGNHTLPKNENIPPQKSTIRLDYILKFQDAFLIDDPDAEPDEDEAEFNFLIIDGRYTIPGSSVKGVFRNRSQMIAKTIHIPIEKLEKVFGFAHDEDDMDNKNTTHDKNEINNSQKSRIYFSYAFLQDPTPNKKLLNGVSIDRFTGGAAEAALFDFKLLMNGTFSGSIILELTNETLYYLPFLYMVIRDIREQDLSFGFGRTKGWGKAHSFDFTLTLSQLSPDHIKYFKDGGFDLFQLELLHKSNIKMEVA